MRRAAVCLLPLLVTDAAGVSGVDPLVVQTASGFVRGIEQDEYRVFRGIPYAAPPTGDLRFRPPQRHPGWKDVLDASDFGPSCLQSASGCWNTLNVSRMSEDCLTVNVVTPKAPGVYPVMLYIHAGEFRCGSSNDKESNWPFFAKDIVYVSFNFRLGALGFLALDALRSRHPNGGTGNYGLLDQRFAMQWVQENIAAFGGDTSRVTIWGESSGGASVGYHLTANGRAPTNLFKRAILESPGLTQVKTWQDARVNADFVLAQLAAIKSPACHHTYGFIPLPDNRLDSWKGQAPLLVRRNLTLPAAKVWCHHNASCVGFWRTGNVTTFMDRLSVVDQEAQGLHDSTAYVKAGPILPQERLLCLLSANARDLVNKTLDVPRDDTFETDGWAPVLDGVDLVEPILDRIVAGEIAEGVDILSGGNLDDGTEFMSLTPALKCNASMQDYQTWLKTFYGREMADKVFAAYQPKDQVRPLPFCQDSGPHQPKLDGETALLFNTAMRSAGDKAIICPARRAALEGTGRSFYYSFRKTPTYTANFDDVSIMGAFHGAEIPFAFGADFELTSDEDRALAKKMGCFWRSFAYHGDPSFEACAAVKWPEFKAPGDPVMVLDVTVNASAEDALSMQRCQMFDEAINPMLSATRASGRSRSATAFVV